MWPFRKKDRLADRIRFGDDGFSLLLKGKLQTHVAYENITGIGAFKRDCFIGSQVCLAFRIGGSDDCVVATQDMEGWKALVEAVGRFPGHDCSWLRKVSEPPFESPWIVVWGDAPELRE